MRYIPRALRVAALVLGCGSDKSSEPTPVQRGLRIVAGASVTDTANTILTQALVVEVRDMSGALAGIGTIVRFESVITGGRPEASLRSLTFTSFGPLSVESTDASGRAAVTVQLGRAAGPARIVVSVPTLGLVDTARYTVVPASAALVVVLPRDTAVYVGRSLTLRGSVTDQFGNLKPDPVTWSAAGTSVSITSAGVVTGLQLGQQTVTATAGPRSATGSVSVVPTARIAAWHPTGFSHRLITVDLDGSNFRDLGPMNVVMEPHPRWIPGTNTVVYTHAENGYQTLYTADESGAVRRFFSAPPPTVSDQAEPEPTANGQWLYFSAHDTRCSEFYYCLYRARSDGTAPELLGNFIQQGNVSWRPAPSPDGSKVAFVTIDGAVVIKVFDVGSRTVSSWKVPGQNPSWSPLGNSIAFIKNGGGSLMVMNTDGSGIRAVNSQAYGEQPLSWSPDGRWITARSSSGLELIDAVTGSVLPINYLNAFYYPSLK